MYHPPFFFIAWYYFIAELLNLIILVLYILCNIHLQWCMHMINFVYCTWLLSFRLVLLFGGSLSNTTWCQKMDKLTPVESLSLKGNIANNWSRWKQHYEILSLASGLTKKDAKLKPPHSFALLEQTNWRYTTHSRGKMLMINWR